MASASAQLTQAGYGNRPDGTPKGKGYFGEIPHPNKSGEFSTELTVGVNIDGQDMDIPLLVPSLTRQEIYATVKGQHTDSIVQKAVDHARSRLNQGKSPYAEPDEIYPLPQE